MKTTITSILLIFMVQIVCSQQNNEEKKDKTVIVKSLRSNSFGGGLFEFSFGGGQLNPTTTTRDSLGFSPMQMLQTKVRFGTKKGWDGLIYGQTHGTVGIVFSGGVLLKESLPASAASAFRVSGATDTGLLTEFGTKNAASGYSFDISPELGYAIGDFEINASVGFGYLKTTQKPVSVMQGVSNSAYPALIKILSRPEISNSGFQIKPAFRLSYTPSVVGFWIEANYMSGPEMTTKSYYLTPAGRSGADGYKPDQLLSGTTTEIVRKNKFESFGVSAGVSLALDKKKKPRPKPVGGQDDDCDGLIIVTEDVTMENGQVVKRIVRTQINTNDSTAKLNTIKNNPLYKENTKPNNPFASGSDERTASGNTPKESASPSAQKELTNISRMQPPASSGCGEVIQKTTLPDGTVEEMTFACPDDAIYYRKQTQNVTFGEKTIEKATSGLKDTLKTQVRMAEPADTNETKTKHDTAKNSVSNVR